MRSGHYSLATAHLLTRSETRKGEKYSSFLRVSVATFLFAVASACSETDDTNPETAHIQILDEIPEHIQEVENLTIFPGDAEPMYTAELIPEQTYGREGEPFLTSVTNAAVDDMGRVIILNANSNYEHSLYLYDSDGTYHTQIGGPGKGPGEYGFVFDIQVKAGNIYVRDITNQRINIYDVNDFSFERAMMIEQLPIRDYEAVKGLRLGLIMARNDGNFFVTFSQQGSDTHTYLLMDKNGNVFDFEPLIFPSSFSISVPDRPMAPSLRLGHMMGQTLTALSTDDGLYSIWTRDFLIKKYDHNGIYQSAYYYPIQGLPFDLEWYDIASPFGSSASEVERAIKNSDIELPETLPVLSGLMVDDENRIWAAVRMDSIRDMVEWWILDETGELLARLQRSYEKTIFDIKDGYLYAKEIDEETDAEYVVKYRIEFREGQ